MVSIVEMQWHEVAKGSHVQKKEWLINNLFANNICINLDLGTESVQSALKAEKKP